MGVGGTEPTETPRWHRDKWLDAMWDCRTLTPNERCVAHVYARYAGKKQIAWCKWEEIRDRTGIKSRDAINRAISGLITGGWLEVSEKARQHYSARYRLVLPPAQGSGKRTPGRAAKPARGPANGHLGEGGEGPAVRLTDIPGVRQTTPAVRFPDPISLTQRPDIEIGGTLPPDPLRPDHPAGGRNESTQPALAAVPDHNDTQKVTSKTRARHETVNRPLIAVIENEIEEDEMPSPPPRHITEELLPALAAQLTKINTRKTPTNDYLCDRVDLDHNDPHTITPTVRIGAS